MTARRRFRGGAFGRQFAAEIQRLGVRLPNCDVSRLERASEDQVLSIARRLLPSKHPELLDLAAQRGAKDLARDVARSYRVPTAVTEAVESAYGVVWSLDMLRDAISLTDIA